MNIESISSPAGSPVRTSAPPMPTTPASMASGAACGRSSLESFATFDPDTCSWKTFQLCLTGDLDEFSLTWPMAGTTRFGTAYRLEPLVPSTFVNECLWLPTPVASEWKDRGSVQMLASLEVDSSRVSRRLARRGLEMGLLQPSERVQLNPSFLEWAMSFPIGWTDLEGSETQSIPT